MGNELLQILDYIEQERGISRDSLIRALENAILIGSRKSIHPANELKVKIDPATGAIRPFPTPPPPPPHTNTNPTPAHSGAGGGLSIETNQQSNATASAFA